MNDCAIGAGRPHSAASASSSTRTSGTPPPVQAAASARAGAVKNASSKQDLSGRAISSSGRRAPAIPGADPVTAEAYSHEIIAFGWWRRQIGIARLFGIEFDPHSWNNL